MAKLTPYQRALVEYRRGLVAALEALADALRLRQLEAEITPLHRAPGEVRLGLAARLWRLAAYVASDDALWSQPRGAFEMRALVDGYLESAWLVSKDDPELYERFVEFGRGRLKLYKLHLQDFADQEGHAGLEDALDHLHRRVNDDVQEEFQTINVGSAFGVTARKMADEAGLKPLYNLHYQPLSAEAHGEWDSLVEHDLVRSSDPLHDGFRFGTFSTSPEEDDLELPLQALLFALEGIALLFDSLGVDVSAETQACWDAAEEALGAAVAAARGTAI